MTAETSWTECATQVMEGKEQVWFTVQTIVMEIRDRNMKPSMLHLPPNEACRSLRSCLRHHAKKENGKFVRKQSNSLIQYALRKEVRSRKPQSKRNPSSLSRQKTSKSNGSTVSPLPFLPPSIPPSTSVVPLNGRGAVVVEVDNPNLTKTNRARQPRDSTPSMSGFLLPSPSLSLLGARRTLTVLCAGEAGRPVRRTRGKGNGERARDRVRLHAQPQLAVSECPSDKRYAVFSPEELCSVSAQTCDVVFLKSGYEGSPADVQGDRVRRVLCEVDPDLRLHSDSSDSSEDSDMDDSSDISVEDSSQYMPNFPSLSCHHGNKSQLTSRKPVSMATTAGRKSDIARQISHLLSASSPLVGENLKVLLGTSVLDGLSSAQRHQLTSLLPSVDRGPCGRIQPVALNNSFFGRACREWQDHLALGLHGSRGSRGEKKTRNHDITWKDKFFETNWGERLSETNETGEIFFPREPDPVDPLFLCLKTILESASSRPSPITAPLPPTPPISTSLPTILPITAPPPSLTLTAKPSPEETRVLAETKGSSKPGGSRRGVRVRPNRLAQSGSKLPSRPAVHRPSAKERKTALGVAEESQWTDPLQARQGMCVSPQASRRRVGKNQQASSKRPSQAGSGGCMYLSPLPHKMSYAALIEALHKASQSHKSVLHQPPPPSSCGPALSPPTLHSHPVFLDHFSALHSRSVPTDFLSPAASPPSPLVVSLPRALHSAVISRRAALSDHNYTPMNPDPPSTLPLSLPRTLLPSSPCLCSSHKLTFCSVCNSLYHVNCSHGNLCSTCTRKPALT